MFQPNGISLHVEDHGSGKTRSYREQIDRFIESVSFGRTHATERDSL